MDPSQLRPLVAAVQERLAPATAPASTIEDKEKLVGAWDSLVHHLALGPAPEMRVCPQCGRSGMRAATVCGYCWTKLTPATA